jgi:urea transport system permease protein
MAGQQRLTAETDGAVKSRWKLRWPACSLSASASRAAGRRRCSATPGPGNQALLIPFTDAQHEPDPAVRAAASDSLSKIKHRLLLGDLRPGFMGLSLGSVLLLAALGLAITYGLLG